MEKDELLDLIKRKKENVIDHILFYLDIDISNYIDRANSYYELYRLLFHKEPIIYEFQNVDDAWEFLKENDLYLDYTVRACLKKGLHLSDINTLVLADVLKNELLREELDNYKDKIEDYYNFKELAEKYIKKIDLGYKLTPEDIEDIELNY